MSEITAAEIWERSGGLGRWGLRWLPGIVAGIATGGLAADRGGFFPTTWGWAAVPLCWVIVMALFVRDRITLSRLELAFAGLLFSIPCWYGLSALWSRNVPQTVLEVERALVYPSGVMAVLLVTRRNTARRLLVGILIGITAVCWYALAQRLFPTETPVFDAISTYRLTGPVTYWNALGIYAAVGALVALGLSTTGRSYWARALAAATLPVLLPTMYLTFSRGAWLAMAAGVVAALALSPARVKLATGLIVMAPWPLLAVVLASRSTALTRLTTDLARAQHDGHLVAIAVGLLALASALAAIGYAMAERRVVVDGSARHAWSAMLGLGVVALLVAAVVRWGSPVTIVHDGWKSFTGPPVQVTSQTNLNARLFSLSSNGRVDIWSKAADAFTAHPLGGIGGGSFERWWNLKRETPLKVVDAHSLYLEVLAELGPLGLLLVLGAIGVPIAAAVRNRREPLVPLVFGAFLAFALHAGIDWDWEVAGVTLGALLVGVALLSLARDGEPRARGGAFRWPVLAVALAVGLFSLYTLVGNRYVEDSGSGSLVLALDQKDRADAWIPWQTEALRGLGDAQRLNGENASAIATYKEAIARHPGDYLLWLDLALASAAADRPKAAQEALRLNPLSPEVDALRPFLGLPPRAAAGAAGQGSAGSGTATTPAATTTLPPLSATATGP